MFQPFAFYGSGESDTPDADAWIVQVLSDGGSLTTTEQDAVKTLESDLKTLSGSAGLYDKLLAIYPLVGGDEASCKYNLKGADTSFDYTLGFSGSWTYDANGVTGDGSTTYANSGLSPAAISGSGTGIGLHIYLTVNVQSPSSYDWGANEQSLICGFNNTQLYGKFNSGAGYVTVSNQVTGTGNFYTAMHDQNDPSGLGYLTMWKDGTGLISSGQTWNKAETRTFYLGNDNRGASPVEFGNKGYGFAAISNYLLDRQVVALNTAVQTYNSTLGR